MSSRVLRGVVATASAAGVCVLLAAVARDSWALALGPGALRASDVLLALVCSTGLLLALWLLVGLVLSALAQLPGAAGRGFAVLAERVTPAAVRKTVALVLGTSLAAAAAPGTAVAAALASGRPALSSVSVDVAAVRPGGAGPVALPVPQQAAHRATVIQPGPHPPAESEPDPGFRPTAPQAPAQAATLDPLQAPARTSSAAADHYVVRRGDTLWDIAARHLGPRVSTSAIAREWPRWYAVNRAVIGPDPSLLQPGQQLRPPLTPDRAR